MVQRFDHRHTQCASIIGSTETQNKRTVSLIYFFSSFLRSDSEKVAVGGMPTADSMIFKYKSQTEPKLQTQNHGKTKQRVKQKENDKKKRIYIKQITEI